MDYKKIGDSGLFITQLTYGTALTIGTELMNIEQVEKLIDTAWSIGIRSFDTSNNYGDGQAEILLGKVLKKYNRQDFVVSTKGSWPIGDGPYYRGLSSKHISYAIDESLKRLDMDYVDIYYAHRYDPKTPMIEIIRTFNKVIQDSKALYWATSEWPVDAIKECIRLCDELNLIKPIGDQFIFSFAVDKALKNGVVKYCKETGYGMLGFSPLAQGLLTGKYINGIPKNSRIAKSKKINYDKTKDFYEQNASKIDFFLNQCELHHLNPTHVAIRWVMQQGVLPVIGASKPSQLLDNLKAMDMMIPDSFWDELEKGVSKDEITNI